MNKTEEIHNILAKNKKLNDLIQKTAISIERTERNLQTVYILILLAKTLKTHRAIILLCEKGYGEDAAILNRTIFESMIEMLYIFNKNTEDRLGRYFNYSHILKQKYLKIIDKQSPDFITKQISPKERRRIRKNGEKTQKEYAYNHKGWAGINRREMAIELKMTDSYDIFYPITSCFSHTDSEALNHYLVEQTDEININFGYSDKLVSETLFSTLEFFMTIAKKWNDVLKLNISDDIENI